MRRLAGFAFVLVFAWLSPVAAQERRVDFNRDIRPILSNTCYKCHGPDEAERKAGLRLDQKEAAFKTRFQKFMVPRKARP